jgi:sterol desaturase/sphingolipid hydroxylase (fatty acid hydroxylase superfamily)
LFKFDYKNWKHALPNLFFTFTTIIINFTLAFLLLETAARVSINNFGLINWLPEMPLWLYAVLGIVLLDFFGAYLVCFTEHKIKPLWRVYLVHHSDPKVDTTSENRHHPIESVLRFAFTLLGVFRVGTPIAIVFM